ncbi:MAG: UbiX family flavin prenyltransferase, partial [Phycisphaerales bacterium]
MPRRIVVGITGASGAPYAVRTIELLARAGVEVHLAISTLGRRLLHDELDISKPDPDRVSNGHGQHVVIHNDNDLGATPASGSFLHDGMIIVPCSSNTIGAIASGLTQSLVQRAAMVTLKERRKLILAHRETPVTTIDLKNMVRVSEAGAIVCPLSPGYYLNPQSVDDLIDFMAGRLLDLVGVEHDLNTR